MVNMIDRPSRQRVRIISDFRYVRDSLFVKFVQYPEQNFHRSVIGYGVRRIEHEIIDAGVREHLHVLADDPGVVHRIIAEQRLRKMMVRVPFPAAGRHPRFFRFDRLRMRRHDFIIVIRPPEAVVPRRQIIKHTHRSVFARQRDGIVCRQNASKVVDSSICAVSRRIRSFISFHKRILLYLCKPDAVQWSGPGVYFSFTAA